MNHTVKELLESSASVKMAMAANGDLTELIYRAAATCVDRLKAGGTIYTCGNGGSTCDAMHFAEELVARYKRNRPGLRAQHLMDPSTITCWSNDFDFVSVFERQVQTFCGANDILIGFSTSGNSHNIVRAVEAAKLLGTFTIAMTGRDGGVLGKIADLSLVVPAPETERIQEGHITIVHILCELIETTLFPNAMT